MGEVQRPGSEAIPPASAVPATKVSSDETPRSVDSHWVGDFAQQDRHNYAAGSCSGRAKTLRLSMCL